MTPARKDPSMDTYSGRCGARLKELREKNGMSVADLAGKIGVASRTIYAWESQERDIALSSLPDLASAFKLKSPRSVLSEK